MRIIKSFVTAVVFLLAFESLISAEMTEMSLQERMGQSDAVVVGEIIESRNTGKEIEMGTEHWLATCRVERYIKGPKIHKPDVEEAKAVKLISIAFVQVPMRTPPPIKLMEGKKYLLFLRDSGSQYQGEVAYEMITPYHGAFEAGEDYFVHDEQNPEYPQAVKLSFEAIVSRLTNVLLFNIKSDKNVYEVGEDVGLTLEFKNVGAQNVWLLKKIFPPADLQRKLYKIDGERKEDISLPMPVDILRPLPTENDFKELLPQEVFSIQITLKDFQQESTLQEGNYEMSLELNLPSYLFFQLKITPWVGSVLSNAIKFEIKGSVSADPPPSLSFLADIPEFGEFGLEISESEIREIAQRNSLVLEVGQNSFFVMNKDGETLALSMSDGKCSGIQRLPKQIKAELAEGIDIRDQLNMAAGYWYAYFREKMLGEGRALRNVHTEGEWTVAEFFGKHGFTPLRVLTRFLDAEETKIQAVAMVLGDIESLLRFASRGPEEGIREIEVLTGLNLKDNACVSPQRCLTFIETNKDYFVWDEEKDILVIAEQERTSFGRAVRGMVLSIKTDKTTYKQNEPIIITSTVRNFLPASGIFCTVVPVNARMLIHSEVVFEVRNEKGEYVHFLPPEPPPALTAKDFRMLDGGQSIESQEEIASRLGKRPLSPGVYRIQATYQNYEFGKSLGLPPSCAGDSVLLEGGPAWTGRVFSSTVTIEVVE